MPAFAPNTRIPHERGKTGDITSDDKLSAIKFACMAEVPTDNKPNVIRAHLEDGRGAEEEGEAKEEGESNRWSSERRAEVV